MPRTFLQQLPSRCPIPNPWLSQPRVAAHAARCAYCGVHAATVRCGPEHTAYTGEWLCLRCYSRLFEGPVLFAGDARR